MTETVARGKAEKLNKLKLRPMHCAYPITALVSSRSARAASGWYLIWSEEHGQWVAVGDDE